MEDYAALERRVKNLEKLLAPGGLLAGILRAGQTEGRILYRDVTLAAAGETTIGDVAKPHGLLVITETLSTASNALFFVNGGNNSVDEISDPDAAYSASDLGDDFNVFYDGGVYTLQNNTGGSRRFRYWLLNLAG